MLNRSCLFILFLVLFCGASFNAFAVDASAQAEDEAAPGTTKGVIDIKDHQRPKDATQLVGEDKHVFVAESKRGTDWTFADGELTASVRAGDSLLTPASYNDFVMHVEFNVPHVPGKSQGNDGNSGVYIQRRYELQILNSYEVPEEKYKAIYCGSIYKFKKPDKLVNKPAGQWQSFDIVFRAARFAGDKKTADARITVYQNGVRIHDDVAIPDKTGRGLPEGPEAMPIRLQGHGSPVRFRNVWIKELNLK